MVLTTESDHNRPPSLQVSITLLVALCFTFLIMTEQGFENGLMLHSEMSIYEDSSYYSDDEWVNEDQTGGSWFEQDARMLKSGGGRSSGSSRSSGYRSYGNCYGDRCDSAGGSSTQLAIIVGSIVGGCCLILGCYCLYHYCKQQIKDKRRRERRKARGNQVSNSDFSMSDSDAPVEPIVIMPNQQDNFNNEGDTQYQMHQQTAAPINNGYGDQTRGTELPGAYASSQYYQQQQQQSIGGAAHQYGIATGLAATPVMPAQPQQKQGGYVMGASAAGIGPSQQQNYPSLSGSHTNSMNHQSSTQQSLRASGGSREMGLSMAMAQAQPSNPVIDQINRDANVNRTSNDLNDLEDHNFNQAPQADDKQNY